MLQGLRTAIYSAPNIEEAKAWYTKVLGFGPYFDEPYYVGFDVGGYELGLDPDAASTGLGGAVAYWGVADIAAALRGLLELGAAAHAEIQFQRRRN